VILPRPLRRAGRRLIELSASLTGTVTGVATEDPVAALTFDDGPHPVWTPMLLDALERRGALATFFLVGRAAAAHPGIVARMRSAGHAVGNHTFDHPSLPSLPAAERRRQILACQETLGPRAARLFRPPYGHQTFRSLVDALRLGYQVIGWSAAAGDWRDEPPERLVERVERTLGPGTIVLFHDRLATALDPAFCDRAATVRAVEMLLDRWEGRLSFVPLPDLLARGRARKRHWYERPGAGWDASLRPAEQ